MNEIEAGDVCRYCKPSTLTNGEPKSSAFQKRENERYLSVYLLDFFSKETEIENVREVKLYLENINFNCKPNGSFAVINIQQSKQYILTEAELEITYKDQNLPHCGIFNSSNDLLIEKLLAECVRENYLVKDL